MRSRRVVQRRSLMLGVCVVLASSACSDGPAAPAEEIVDVQLLVVSGDAQSAPAGQELPLPLVADVLNAQGQPVANLLVNFRVVSGGGRPFAGSARTNAQGRVQDYWTLGPVPGTPQVMQVRVVRNGTKRMYASFTATATVPSAPPLED